MPPQQGLRSYAVAGPPIFGQHATRRRLEGSISISQIWPSDLPTEHSQLMTKHDDLKIRVLTGDREESKEGAQYQAEK